MVKVTKINTPVTSKASKSLTSLSVFKRWYTKKPAIITLLIFFFPLGLSLMWKFAEWSKKTKWIITGVLAILIIMGFIGIYNSTPSIIVHNAKDNRINTDDEVYTLKGRVSTTKGVANLTIDGRLVPLTEDSEFSYEVTLEEGDNAFDLASTNENGTNKKHVIIHRTTQAELASRAESELREAEINANEENRKQDQEKAKVDAKAKDDADKKTEATTRATAEAREPRHTYDEFYSWVTTYMRSPDGSGLTRRSYITDQCDALKDLDGDGDKDQYFDKSCLQDKYKDYIKPSAFEYGSSADNGGGWLCPSGQEYQYLCSRFFDMETHLKAQFSGAYGVNVDEEKEKAKTIYNEIALTKGGN